MAPSICLWRWFRGILHCIVANKQPVDPVVLLFQNFFR